MGELGEEKRSIPDWQKQAASASPTPVSPKCPDDYDTASQPNLIDHARRFLEDESIRDAPRERKVVFLEKKGLDPDQIQRLLGPLPGAQTSTSNDKGTEMKTVHDSNISSSHPSSPPKSPSKPPPSTNQTGTSATTSTSRHLPPIITYPEFVLKSTKPPPLITVQRLSYALYTFATLSAITYGAGRYLLQPMLSSLTSSRRQLAAEALQNLENLNAKLEANVSHVPSMTASSTLLKQCKQRHEDEAVSDDVESIDSDPTELYHRDIATQTSPSLTRTPSQTTSSSNTLPASSSSPHHILDSANPLKLQDTRLQDLDASLAKLLELENTATAGRENTRGAASDLKSYLDSIEFHNGAYLEFTDPYGSGAGTKTEEHKTKLEAEMAVFRAEIRSVKGALLSSRNFPAGKPAIGAGIPVR